MSSKHRPSEVVNSRFNLPTTRIPAILILFIATTLTIFLSSSLLSSLNPAAHSLHAVPFNADEIRAQCLSLRSFPGPQDAFLAREVSDRYEPGTNATLIQHAVIFTGEKDGNVTLHGDILLDKGIIKSIGKVPRWMLERKDLNIVDANGAWVTPGLGQPCICHLSPSSPTENCLVDLHSHIGIASAPVLSGPFVHHVLQNSTSH